MEPMSKERQATTIAMWVIRTFLLAFIAYAAIKNVRGIYTLYCTEKGNFVWEFESRFK
jgi:hypothetical protein